MDHVECVVIGAGVVGLAVARSLARSGRETLVLEAADAIGTATSSRNSEVIHAGVYYPHGSLKARLCVAGRDLLYRFCAEHGVEVNRCGKFIVATEDAQVAKLSAIEAGARLNGVLDLRLLDQREALRLEPELRCSAALWSPSTGIVDGHGFMVGLQGDLERFGGRVVLGSAVQRGHCGSNRLRLTVGEGAPYDLEASLVVNCAGLDAQRVARSFDGLNPETVPELYYAKGNYYGMEGRAPFRRLIYPVPEDGGLGVHLTLDLVGRARFGPDVEWVAKPDYGVDPGRADGFYSAIRAYWPGLPRGSLRPDYAGIRPKLQGAGSGFQDFMIQGPASHGVPGLVNLYGIESPGLTAALAIGDHVAALAQGTAHESERAARGPPLL
jgi:L-2-hydroxyglutarate oxidase LhgO